MSPLETEAALADLFSEVDALKAVNLNMAQTLQAQREALLRLTEQVSVLQAEEKSEPPTVNVSSPDVVVHVPSQAAPVIQNNVVMPTAKDKKLRVSYTDYQGAKKTMEIESINE